MRETIRERIGERRHKGWQVKEYVDLMITLGEYERARALADEGLQLGQAFSDRLGIAQGYLSLGRIEIALERPGLGVSYLELSLEAGRQTGHLQLQLKSLTELGMGALQNEQPGDARRYLEDARDTFEPIG